jgi:hypothetical protein
MSCPSALIGHPEGSANGFPLKDCGNDGEGLFSFFKRLNFYEKQNFAPRAGEDSSRMTVEEELQINPRQ